MFRTTNIKRLLNWDDVRKVCIQNDYYTFGDNKDYEEMLGYVMKLNNCTDEDLIGIAQDIFNHTDIERICEEGGVDRAGAFASILFNLSEEVHTIFTVEEV